MVMNARSVLSLTVCFCFLYQQHIYANPINNSNNNNNNDLWELHKQQYKLKFDATENELRKAIFEKNLKYINQVNAENRSYKLKMNHLGHLTAKEVVKGFNAEDIREKNHDKIDYLITTKNTTNKGDLPTEIDWRKVGATGAMESHYKLKYGHMKLFSEQQLVSCDHRTIDMGCLGGLPDEAFEYVRQNGLVTEDEYPYKASDSRCAIDNRFIAKHNFTKIKSYSVVGDSEEDLTYALASRGPVAIAIDASIPTFQFYSDGVYDERNCRNEFQHLDHAVLAVGYGYDKKSNKDYYIVKNSWGESWGEQGYIRMVRNAGNRCGVATYPIVPYF